MEEGRSRLEMRSSSSWLNGSKVFHYPKGKRRKWKWREEGKGEKVEGGMPGVLLQGFSSVSAVLLPPARHFMHCTRGRDLCTATPFFPLSSFSLSLSTTSPLFYGSSKSKSAITQRVHTREPAEFTRKTARVTMDLFQKSFLRNRPWPIL